MMKRAWKTVSYGVGYARLNLIPRPHHAVGLPAEEDDPTRAVLLVPGYMGTNQVMVKYQVLFHRLGIRAYTVNIGLYSMVSFQTARALLERRIYAIREERPQLRQLSLVGHSMGGLVSFDMLGQPVLAGLQPRLAAIGSPFTGTWAALMGAWFSPSAMELLPVHPRYREMPSRQRVRVPFKIFAGSEDLLAPADRCVHPDAETLIFKTGHVGLLFEKNVFREVHRFVAKKG